MTGATLANGTVALSAAFTSFARPHDAPTGRVTTIVTTGWVGVVTEAVA